MQAFFERTVGAPLGDLFDAWIRSPAEVDCRPTLARVGLVIDRTPRADGPGVSLGVRTRGEGGRTIVASALRDSAAWRAGIDAGDELIAVDGSRIDGLDAVLRGRKAGDEVDVLLARDGRIAHKRVVLDAARLDRVALRPDPDAPPIARDAFARWLGEPHPAWKAPPR
jgi:predicted metalloprotease with PDZ domain